MYTIIGSGFGLYGYLPALVRELNMPVALPEAYRAKLLARPELLDCDERVTWKADRNACLAAAENVILCVPPRVQSVLCQEMAALTHIRAVVLEKPVAHTPAEAARVYETLDAAHKLVVVDYIFLYLTWYRTLEAMLRDTGQGGVAIVWTFKAHHFQHHLSNWKGTPEDGGGVLRFYGIHLLAVLASFGYLEPTSSCIESAAEAPGGRWRAEFSNAAGARSTVLIDSNSEETQFSISPLEADPAASSLRLRDPFDDADFKPRWPAEDKRIRPVARMLQATCERGAAPHALYAEVNALWLAVENSTRYSS